MSGLRLRKRYAASPSVDGICRFIGLDSLRRLSIDGLLKGAGASPQHHPFCLACFTGDYPVTFEGSLRKCCFQDQGQESDS